MTSTKISKPSSLQISDGVAADAIRSKFSEAMSQMYGTEVGLYNKLVEEVEKINNVYIASHPDLKADLGDLARISKERHGAIRLGTAEELSFMAKVFAIMGMQPVGYYDLSIAGLPVHSTAFRPVSKEELDKNPFRIFTSLLRVDLLPAEIATKASDILSKRKIFSKRLLELVEIHEHQNGRFINENQSDEFIQEALKTFSWYEDIGLSGDNAAREPAKATVSKAVYEELHKISPFVADIVCFKGPHINHLTPRVLDIYPLHETLKKNGMKVIPEVQGPPKNLPILLKQTSFTAIDDDVLFTDGEKGKHKARFGEVEHRDCALTKKGMDIYDSLIAQVTKKASEVKKLQGEEAYKEQYPLILNQVFEAFPAKDFSQLRKQQLGYFTYELTEKGKHAGHIEVKHLGSGKDAMEKLIEMGDISSKPIIYEDFLPVSAAGIFKSNLDKDAGNISKISPNRSLFEKSLGRPVLDYFALYAADEEKSRLAVLEKLSHGKNKTPQR